MSNNILELWQGEVSDNLTSWAEHRLRGKPWRSKASEACPYYLLLYHSYAT